MAEKGMSKLTARFSFFSTFLTLFMKIFVSYCPWTGFTTTNHNFQLCQTLKKHFKGEEPIGLLMLRNLPLSSLTSKSRGLVWLLHSTTRAFSRPSYSFYERRSQFSNFLLKSSFWGFFAFQCGRSIREWREDWSKVRNSIDFWGSIAE